MTQQRSVVVKNQFSELERVSQIVEAFGAANGIPQKAIAQLSLALDEILTNIISYAYADGAEHDILLRLAASADDITVRVEDDGRAFNPLDVPPPPLDTPPADRSIGGLGMHLARKMVDRLAYQRKQDKNVLVMYKALVTKP